MSEEITEQSIEEIKEQLLVVDWGTLLDWYDSTGLEGVFSISSELDMAEMIYTMMYSEEDGFFEDWLNTGKITVIDPENCEVFDSDTALLAASIPPYALVQILPVDVETLMLQP